MVDVRVSGEMMTRRFTPFLLIGQSLLIAPTALKISAWPAVAVRMITDPGRRVIIVMIVVTITTMTIVVTTSRRMITRQDEGLHMRNSEADALSTIQTVIMARTPIPNVADDLTLVDQKGAAALAAEIKIIVSFLN
jgi:hypothetical protein